MEQICGQICTSMSQCKLINQYPGNYTLVYVGLFTVLRNTPLSLDQ